MENTFPICRLVMAWESRVVYRVVCMVMPWTLWPSVLGDMGSLNEASKEWSICEEKTYSLAVEAGESSLLAYGLV